MKRICWIVLFAGCAAKDAPEPSPSPVGTAPPTATPAPIPTATPPGATPAPTQVPTTSPTPPPPQTSTLYAVNLDPGGPAVDVLINGAVAHTNLGFQAGTPALGMGTMSQAIDLVETGTTNSLANQSLFTSSGGVWCMAIYGDVTSPGWVASPHTAAAGTLPSSAIQFVNAAPDPGVVDILDVTSGTVLIDDLGVGVADNVVILNTTRIGLDEDNDGTAEVEFILPGASQPKHWAYIATDGLGANFLHLQYLDGSSARVDPAP